ncbi:MAG: Asp-tRNA(Asn)/Glu-tRNA(Gln) amidotransferase subunit GatC [Phycisphaerae bacterium]
MTDAITEQEVRHVAKLSRLKLTDEQVRQFTRQMSDILAYVKKLNELDTANVKPTAHAAPLRNVFREDKAAAGMGVEKVLQNAPDRDGPFFKVPRVLAD